MDGGVELSGIIQVATLIIALIAAIAAIQSALIAERSARTVGLAKYNEASMEAARTFAVSVVKEVDQQSILLGRSCAHLTNWVETNRGGGAVAEDYQRDSRTLESLRESTARWHDVLAQRLFWADGPLNDALQEFDTARESLVLELNNPSELAELATRETQLQAAQKAIYKEVQRMFQEHQAVMINSLLRGRDRKKHLKMLRED